MARRGSRSPDVVRHASGALRLSSPAPSDLMSRRAPSSPSRRIAAWNKPRPEARDCLAGPRVGRGRERALVRQEAVDQGVDEPRLDPGHVAKQHQGAGDVGRHGANDPVFSDEARPVGNSGLKAISTPRPASAASTGLRAWPVTTTTGRAVDASAASAAIRTIGLPRSFSTSFVALAPPAARNRDDGPRPERSRRPYSTDARGCGREPISIRRPPTPIARMSARVIGTSARTRCSTQSKPFSFGERAHPGAPMIGDSAAFGQQQQIAGIDRHAEPLDAPADRLDCGRNDVAPVGDRGGAERDQRVAAVDEPPQRFRQRPDLVRDASPAPRCALRSARGALRAPAASWRRRWP